MESIAARAALSLDPAATLSPERIEAAYRAAAWARHPSRYPDAESRHAAELWAATLQQARATLLAESAASASASAAGPAPRRGLSKAWIAGIVAGASVVVIGLIVGLVFGITALTERLTELAEPQLEGGFDSETVEHHSAAETMFSFPAALEFYSDDRYMEQCSTELEQCWVAGVIPENDCKIMTVSIGYAMQEEQQTPDYVQTLRFYDIVAEETVPAVSSNDDYPLAWVMDVTCHDQPE